MKALVYVEGPSDRAALEALLRPIIATARTNQRGIRFLPLGNKAAVLQDSPRKAAEHLADHPLDCVFALPDLYPKAPFDPTPDRHGSYEELERAMRRRFVERADRAGVDAAARDRFRVHCMKHDLEVLLLAAPEQLRMRLGTGDQLRDRWRRPVEDQNDQMPPKRVVEALFNQYRRRSGYSDMTDAPWILERASLDGVVAACPQRFAPFVGELQAFAEGRPLPG